MTLRCGTSIEELEALARGELPRPRVAQLLAHVTGCPECGPRPEPDAAYCSNCGRYLRDRCADCGAPVQALDARYCVGCGNRLAA